MHLADKEITAFNKDEKPAAH